MSEAEDSIEADDEDDMPSAEHAAGSTAIEAHTTPAATGSTTARRARSTMDSASPVQQHKRSRKETAIEKLVEASRAPRQVEVAMAKERDQLCLEAI